MLFGMDGRAIPPYNDAQMQLENRELKAQIARATRLLKEAQALAEVEQQTAYRMSERVTALEAEAVVLRDALKARSWGHWIDSNDGCPWCRQMEFDQLGMKVGHRDDCQRQAALTSPSPATEAVRGVLEAAVKIRGLNVEVCDCERCIKNEGYSEKFWNTMSELEFRVDAYLALRDGRVDGGWNDSETKIQVS